MTLSEFQDALQRLSSREFEYLVRELLQRSERFRGLTVAGPTIDGGVDFVVPQRSSSAKRVIVDVKHRRLIAADVAKHVAGAPYYLAWPGESLQVVLVVSGAVTAEARQILSDHHVELWEPSRLAPLVTPEIAERFFGTQDVPPRDESAADEGDDVSKAVKLSKALTTMPCGQPYWAAYQRLIAEIFEFIFCPPLDPPLYEFTDADRKNRRDLIFENPAADGYWAQVRSTYSGHYIVADAKNYCAPLNKSPVLEIGHYLKPYGCGMFALLVSRSGLSAGGAHAVREQWVSAENMIVSVKDADVLKMLNVRGAGGRADEVVRRLVADFRMSL